MRAPRGICVDLAGWTWPAYLQSCGAGEAFSGDFNSILALLSVFRPRSLRISEQKSPRFIETKPLNERSFSFPRRNSGRIPEHAIRDVSARRRPPRLGDDGERRARDAEDLGGGGLDAVRVGERLADAARFLGVELGHHARRHLARVLERHVAGRETRVGLIGCASTGDSLTSRTRSTTRTRTMTGNAVRSTFHLRRRHVASVRQTGAGELSAGF